MKNDRNIATNENTNLDENLVVKFHDYTIHKKGQIYNKRNRLVSINKKNGTVRLNIDGERKIMIAGRLVFELFTGRKLKRGDVIQFKDGDKSNAALENIEILDRKKYFKDYEWEKKIKPEQEEEIRMLYNLEKKKQARYDRKYGPTIKDIANNYDCCETIIWKIIHKQY